MKKLIQGYNNYFIDENGTIYKNGCPTQGMYDSCPCKE